MVTSRWLLQLQVAPEPNTDIPVFQILLQNLDDPERSVILKIETLDEMLLVLMDGWQQRANQPPDERPGNDYIGP